MRNLNGRKEEIGMYDIQDLGRGRSLITASIDTTIDIPFVHRVELSLWMGDSQERIRYQHLGPIELALSDDESGFQYVRAQPVLVTTTNAVFLRRTCEILFISRKPERFLASWKKL